MKSLSITFLTAALLSASAVAQQTPGVKERVPFPIQIATFTFEEQSVSLRRAIEDIARGFPKRYDAAGYSKRLQAVEASNDAKALDALRREALLANPAIDFDDVLLVRRFLGKKRSRTSMGRQIGFVGNNAFSMQNAIRNFPGNEIAVLRDIKSAARYEKLYQPDGDKIISDIDLNFDGERILFSSINSENAFRLYEIKADGSGFRQLTPDTAGSDVDHFDACYLPNDDIIFTSTASFLGMPCIDGSPRMSSLYRLSPESGKIRQLSYDQDSSWCPTVMNNGSVLYLRWEYTDTVHSNNRLLMTMNPDGTNQRSYLFGNSYFPAAFYYARPIPGDPATVIGVASGHHGHARTGRLLLADPRIGEHEADGVTQEIPGYGKKVEPIIRDRLVDGIWPHNVHPFPIAESGTNTGAGKYFLTAMKPTPDALWGIYLVDIFDNRVLLYEAEEYAAMEPIPLKAQAVPPQRPDLVDPAQETATVFIQDIYAGPGLRGTPRGTAKALRVGSYEFSPSHGVAGSSNGSGGLMGTIGVDGPWDIKRILGTVPIYEDGSVHFTIPASTPIFVQPIDESGQAIQLMRSWFVGQPGERVSCIGCHESAKDAPLPTRSLAASATPHPIKPWTGQMRNFDYDHEIQPIIDRNCMSCHDGKPANGRYQSLRADFQNQPIPYLGSDKIEDWSSRYRGSLNGQRGGGNFSKGYFELFRMVRGPGIESDMHLLSLKEFSADTTELFQMLKKGHHGVELSPTEWLKITEWIDLNTPYHGDRRRIVAGHKNESSVHTAMRRSSELAAQYGGATDHFAPPESKTPIAVTPRNPDPEAVKKRRETGTLPFTAKAANETKDPITLDLGGGQAIKLVYIPSGQFVMGSASGELDELPMHPQRVEKGFWMAETEIGNAQFRQFESQHSSRHEDRVAYQFGQPCYDVDGDDLPAVRLSWQQAMKFCEWLSEKTGKQVTLPSEIQWEWAARAGTGSPFWFGEAGTDFSAFANLADKQTENFAEDTAAGQFTYFEIVRIKNPSRYEAYIPAIKSIDDDAFLQGPRKTYRPNPWGLYDMHGNVAEWTRSVYQTYPLKNNNAAASGPRVVRGGSWRDRPHRATSSYRLAYPEFQPVFNVGFRIIIPES